MYWCCVASLSWFRLQFSELRSSLKMSQNLIKSLYYSPWIFAKNGSEITKIFYYIFLYILMYWCCVASLSWFRLQFSELRSSLKMSQNLIKSLYYSPWIFAKNGSEITKIFYYIFLYILMYWCCVASLSWFRLQFSELRSSLKMSQNLIKSLYYSPWIFAKNGSEITKIFYYIFLYILMYWCCVASLSWFRLQFFELRSSLKMSQNLIKSLYYSPWIFPKNGSKITKIFYYIFLYILMYWCCVASLSWFWLQFSELRSSLKMSQNLIKSLYYSPWIFAKNGSEITKIFYYIFLYILMYWCCVASLSWFRLQFSELRSSLKMSQNLIKSLYYSPWIFAKNGSEITKIFYYIFLYILMYWCCVASLSWFRLQFFELRSSLKMSQNLIKSLYYSPWIFPKNGSKITKIFYYIFLYILMYWCCVASLSWFRLQFFELRSSLKMSQNLKKSLYYSPWIFAKNGQNFLLHFLIHIDLLMLCSKYELIPTSIFRVTAILRKHQNFEKITVL